MNTLLEKLDALEPRFHEVGTLITDPSVISDQQRYVRLTKEYSDGNTNALQASAILKSGGKMTGKLKITATPTEADDVVDKKYVNAIIPAYTAADNGKVLGVVDGKLAWVTKA